MGNIVRPKQNAPIKSERPEKAVSNRAAKRAAWRKAKSKKAAREKAAWEKAELKSAAHTLITLPREIQLLIFKSLDSTEEVVSMVLSCSLFHRIFKANEQQICMAIAYRVWSPYGALEAMDVLRRDVLPRDNASFVYDFWILSRMQDPSRKDRNSARSARYCTKVADTLRRRSREIVLQKHDRRYPKGRSIVVGLSELYAMEAFEQHVVVPGIRIIMKRFAKKDRDAFWMEQYRAQQFSEWQNLNHPIGNLKKKNISGLRSLSFSEVERLSRAIYNIIRALEHIHSVVLHYPSHSPYLQGGSLVVCDGRSPDPKIFVTHPTIDVKALFESCSVQEHMQMVAAFDPFEGDNGFYGLLTATLYDRLLNLGRFQADTRRQEMQSMLSIVQNSLWDFGQPQVAKLLERVSHLGWEGGFNKSRYITVQSRAFMGTVEDNKEMVVPNLLKLGSFGCVTWCMSAEYWTS
ncbi:hypothetical protein BJ508DRAFT_326828 [Ascobolus immersus RN42]|uniref:F-box domain-containing protein n=1 Tax=Ascobolus immersus RN42 TaxID=1160509 RepID=A0A3N4IA20_ASCIM|nr:hypothetical protein BJ508DRAFT_326828 [Ascobolus immersus RN42]